MGKRAQKKTPIRRSRSVRGKVLFDDPGFPVTPSFTVNLYVWDRIALYHLPGGLIPLGFTPL